MFSSGGNNSNNKSDKDSSAGSSGYCSDSLLCPYVRYGLCYRPYCQFRHISAPAPQSAVCYGGSTGSDDEAPTGDKAGAPVDNGDDVSGERASAEQSSTTDQSVTEAAVDRNLVEQVTLAVLAALQKTSTTSAATSASDNKTDDVTSRHVAAIVNQQLSDSSVSRAAVQQSVKPITAVPNSGDGSLPTNPSSTAQPVPTRRKPSRVFQLPANISYSPTPIWELEQRKCGYEARFSDDDDDNDSNNNGGVVEEPPPESCPSSSIGGASQVKVSASDTSQQKSVTAGSSSSSSDFDLLEQIMAEARRPLAVAVPSGRGDRQRRREAMLARRNRLGVGASSSAGASYTPSGSFAIAGYRPTPVKRKDCEQHKEERDESPVKSGIGVDSELSLDCSNPEQRESEIPSDDSITTTTTTDNAGGRGVAASVSARSFSCVGDTKTSIATPVSSGCSETTVPDAVDVSRVPDDAEVKPTAANESVGSGGNRLPPAEIGGGGDSACDGDDLSSSIEVTRPSGGFLACSVPPSLYSRSANQRPLRQRPVLSSDVSLIGLASVPSVVSVPSAASSSSAVISTATAGGDCAVVDSRSHEVSTKSDSLADNSTKLSSNVSSSMHVEPFTPSTISSTPCSNPLSAENSLSIVSTVEPNVEHSTTTSVDGNTSASAACVRANSPKPGCIQQGAVNSATSDERTLENKTDLTVHRHTHKHKHHSRHRSGGEGHRSSSERHRSSREHHKSSGEHHKSSSKHHKSSKSSHRRPSSDSNKVPRDGTSVADEKETARTGDSECAMDRQASDEVLCGEDAKLQKLSKNLTSSSHDSSSSRREKSTSSHHRTTSSRSSSSSRHTSSPHRKSSSDHRRSSSSRQSSSSRKDSSGGSSHKRKRSSDGSDGHKSRDENKRKRSSDVGDANKSRDDDKRKKSSENGDSNKLRDGDKRKRSSEGSGGRKSRDENKRKRSSDDGSSHKSRDGDKRKKTERSSSASKTSAAKVERPTDTPMDTASPELWSDDNCASDGNNNNNGYSSDDSMNEADRVLAECERMFNEYQPPPPQSSDPHALKEAKEMRDRAAREASQLSGSNSEHCAGKQRTAHSGSEQVARNSGARIARRISAVQAMQARWQKLAEMQQARIAELEQQATKQQQRQQQEQITSAVSSIYSSSPTTTTGTTTTTTAAAKSQSRSLPFLTPGSTNKRIRVAHVPNVSALLTRPAAPKHPPNSSTSTLASSSATVQPTVSRSLAKGTSRVAHQPSLASVARPRIINDGSSKVPIVMRQRHLDLLCGELEKRFPDNLAEAFKQALSEEQAAYDRITSRTGYPHAIASTLRRLRSSSSNTSSTTIICSTPITSTSTSNNNNNNKSSGSSSATRSVAIGGDVVGNLTVSHRSVLAGKGATLGSWSIEKNKHSVSIDSVSEFHSLLTRHVLSQKQLEQNGYPRSDPTRPGRAIVTCPSTRLRVTRVGAPRRECVRCNRVYSVDVDGSQLHAEQCIYHWGRIYTFRGEKRYSCCSTEPPAEGCCVADLHVCDNFDPDNLIGFQETFSKSDCPEDDQAVYALDCEMCYTTGGCELTRITVVDMTCSTVYETFVKPSNTIIDYNTRFSGITAEDMNGVTVSISDVQAVLLNMFSEKTILIGHSLESDFKALKLIHSNVVDTSVVFPHKLGPPFKRALRNLVSDHLKKIIQNDVGGHDSAEDARACVELMLWKLKEDAKSFR